MTVEAPPEHVRRVVAEAVATHHGVRGSLLPILHSVQTELGYVPSEAVPLLAAELNLSTAEVHGVVTFYRDFRSAPPGQVTVRVCRAEACQSVGGGALLEHAKASLGLEHIGTTDDGSVSLDEVFCLGNCALGPAVQVGEQLYGRVTAARLDALIGQSR